MKETPSTPNDIHPAALEAAWDTAHAANEEHSAWKTAEEAQRKTQEIYDTFGSNNEHLAEAAAEFEQTAATHKNHFDTLIEMAGVVYKQPTNNEPRQDHTEQSPVEPSGTPTPEVTVPSAESVETEQRPYQLFVEQFRESREALELPPSDSFAGALDATDNIHNLTDNQRRTIETFSYMEARFDGAYKLAQLLTPEEFTAFKEKVATVIAALDNPDDPTHGQIEGEILDLLKQDTSSNYGVAKRERDNQNNRRGMRKSTLAEKATEVRQSINGAVEASNDTKGFGKQYFSELTDIKAKEDLPYFEVLDFMVAKLASEMTGKRRSEARAYNIEAFEENYKHITERRGEITALIEEALRKMPDTVYDDGYESNGPRLPYDQYLRGLLNTIDARYGNKDRNLNGNSKGYMVNPMTAVRLQRRFAHGLDRTRSVLIDGAPEASTEINTDDF